MSVAEVDLTRFGLEPGDALALSAMAEQVTYRPGQSLLEAKRPILHCHFVTDGLASVTCDLHNGVEVVSVSAPGFIGVQALLGSPVTVYPAHAVTSVTTLRLPSDRLLAAMEASPPLRAAMMALVDAGLSRVLRKAACHALHALDTRLASWLLAHHHAVGKPLRLTHDVIARLMGVRRATVTTALHHLEERRAVRSSRAHIQVRSVRVLCECSCGCHDVPASWVQEAEDALSAPLFPMALDIRTRPRPAPSVPRWPVSERSAQAATASRVSNTSACGSGRPNR